MSLWAWQASSASEPACRSVERSQACVSPLRARSGGPNVDIDARHAPGGTLGVLLQPPGDPLVLARPGSSGLVILVDQSKPMPTPAIKFRRIAGFLLEGWGVSDKLLDR